jgi:hypothetical protein
LWRVSEKGLVVNLFSVLFLVVTTPGSSTVGVELPTDDYRQPVTSLTKTLFLLLWWKTIFWGGEMFFLD